MTFFHTKTDDARCASRSAQRRRSFPSSSTASSPTCPFLPSSPSGGVFPSTSTFGFSYLPFHYHFRHDMQTSRAIRAHERRAIQKTEHDETSRARQHEHRTAPCQSTARRRHRLARATGARVHVPITSFGTLTLEKMGWLSRVLFYPLRRK